jgi:hypothetical protein
MKIPGLRNARSFVIVCLALIALASLPIVTRARFASTSVNIVNNSSREVRNVYASHVGADDWSNDLLTAPLSPSHSSVVSGFTCDQQQVKVIAEDQEGCFSSTIVNCGDSSTWTITDTTARDCGN